MNESGNICAGRAAEVAVRWCQVLSDEGELVSKGGDGLHFLIPGGDGAGPICNFCKIMSFTLPAERR